MSTLINNELSGLASSLKLSSDESDSRSISGTGSMKPSDSDDIETPERVFTLFSALPVGSYLHSQIPLIENKPTLSTNSINLTFL